MGCPHLLYMKMTDYIVECGNWQVKVALNDNEHSGEYAYMEAATQAVEGVFGLRTLNMHCELMSLKNMRGEDYFDVENVFVMEMPRPMFSVVMCVYKAKDALTYTKYRLYLSSIVFANAAQPINVELALHAESLEPDKVDQFKKMVSEQKNKRKKS